MSARRAQLELAREHLQESDPVIRRLVGMVGPCHLPRRRNHFAMLVRSIVSQQISTAAARTIYQRLEELVAPQPISAASLLVQSARLREVGVSRQKANYLLDLAAKAHRGEIHFGRFARMSDEAVIEELVQVKGIGRWTAEMLLIFSLGRLDVLPCDDLGIRKAISQLYGLDALPTKQECHRIARPWRPYASVASWYCWRSLEFNGDSPASRAGQT